MLASMDHYRIFYQVARCGNITQAAAALYSSQPNVTHSIKCLEEELGCTLFLRSNKGVRLTPEGELLFSHVAPAMEHLARGEEELLLETRLRTGSVSIGASEVALRCLLLPVLRQFRLEFPGVQVRVSNHSTPQALRALEEGLVDLAVVTTPAEPGKDIQKTDLRQIRETAVCSPGLGLFPARPITLEELAQYPLICLGRDTMTYRLYENWFHENGLPFHPDIEAATADQILPLVRHDLGIGFVPEAFLENGAAGLRRIALQVLPPSRSICLLQRADRPQRPAAKKLLELLEAASAPKKENTAL